jgi:diguanylate cyclase (GGDEF)-like protein/PAS domain S-box-containing protein
VKPDNRPEGAVPPAPDLRGAAEAGDDLERSRRLRLLAENGVDVMALVTPEGAIEWVWEPTSTVRDPHRIALLGEEPWSLVHPDDLDRCLQTLADEVAGGNGPPIEIRVRRADGEYRWAQVVGHVIDDGEAAGKVVVVIRDAHAGVEARVALENSENRFRLAMRGSPQGMAVIGVDGRFQSVNPALCDTLHRPEEWFEHQSLDDIFHADDREADRAVRTRLLAGSRDVSSHERRLLVADGDSRWVLHSIGLQRDRSGEPTFFVSHFHDIADRKDAENRLEYVAHHDQLTGLANRAYLLDEIERALSASQRSGRPTALLMVDLDHFKYVNDSLGHATGDGLLRRAAERIVGAVRRGDLVARQGGDEFVVVMRDLDDPAEAARVAERIVAGFRQPFHVDQADLYTTASVGIAIAGGTSDANTLLAEADTALYVAKDDGRDRSSLFNDELRWAVTQRLRIESGLRSAIARNEFEVWYQPEVDLVDGSISAVEALLRWNHPGGELHSASRFIEVAEDSGLIVDIGEVAIRRAFAQSARWNRRRDGRPLVVRVNLSARQLAEAELLHVIDDALATTGAQPSCVCFEITETAILRDLPVVEANLRGIHERGIALAVDDFGTGYASLTYLRTSPIGILKLDRSFVADVVGDDFSRRLVGGIVALAHGLGIVVTAEGVEERAQADVLRSLGCQRAQGFLYSGALTAADIEPMLV